MAVCRVGRGEPVIHPQQLTLAGRQVIHPALLKAVVGIDLEDQRALAVVAEQSMAVGRRPVRPAPVPALAR